ncbi:hypothetical protein DTO013E5_4101 [Penicillium roqueforti]|uniref:uncharacterized protein n=1 Tax=Penicillium roqueforti TaxID=5082 RepID=UPI00190B04E7|nr:uncharacterized protein LCP9604111_1469 [Penicillium roqueforti]KAF9251473.1 hypothetical protein LCP9604111_1469 [Penicillium roqueforti]KAI1836715.1 hypothetical protein CBS147337_2942 [Penicillium roqueforti]KAI2685148.1 hypothetical protein LCP963914a_4475 [Penicillium roqueforti]KAI2690520.1 hypothetical protein CBS147355_971 [Penicillium roqueforti]KAI2695987.1 hypothetical protein CBS147372_8702 [Penicillium roqueforti]
MTELIFRGVDHPVRNTEHSFVCGRVFVTPFLESIWVPSAAQNLVAPGQGLSKGRNYPSDQSILTHFPVEFATCGAPI